MIDPHLSPSDAVVAIRSFPRRFRALLTRPDDDDRGDPDEIARRHGADGTSAVEHLVAAHGLLDGLLARSTTSSTVDVTSAVATSLGRFTDAADAAAERVDSVTNDQWAESPERLDRVRQVVSEVADHLRATERVLTEVRLSR